MQTIHSKFMTFTIIAEEKNRHKGKLAGECMCVYVVVVGGVAVI